MVQFGESEDVWVMNDFVKTKGQTVVPFTTDYMMDNFKNFVMKGNSLFADAKYLKFIGDATHNQTSQGLKKMALGVAGTHFVNGRWRNTVLPIMYVACSQESKEVLKIAMDALVAAVQARLGFNTIDKIIGCLWDGAPEAIAVFGEMLPLAKGHMCLQHAKVQQGRRFSIGFKHESVKLVELMAFMPNAMFHISAETLLAKLDSAGNGRAAEYFRSSGSPCAFSVVEDEWRAVWQSSYQHVTPGYSTFLNNAVESGWRAGAIVAGKSKNAVT